MVLVGFRFVTMELLFSKRMVYWLCFVGRLGLWFAGYNLLDDLKRMNSRLNYDCLFLLSNYRFLVFVCLFD